MFWSLYSPALDCIVQQKFSPPPPVSTEEMPPLPLPICSHQQGTGVATLQIVSTLLIIEDVKCFFCWQQNCSPCIHSPPAIVSTKVSHSFCVLNGAQHGCKEAGKECHFSFLCSTFYPQICFYFSFHMKGTSEGALFSEHLSIGAVSIKRSARIRSFSALKPFLESVNVLASHTSAHFLWCCGDVRGWRLPPSILHSRAWKSCNSDIKWQLFTFTKITDYRSPKKRCLPALVRCHVGCAPRGRMVDSCGQFITGSSLLYICLFLAPVLFVFEQVSLFMSSLVSYPLLI